MRKIGIVKIGQKIVFDRGSDACKRSNSNGNVDLYRTILLLAENNPNDAFFVLSENDLLHVRMERIYAPSNLIDGTIRTAMFAKEMDVILVFAGLASRESDYELIFTLNNSNCKIVLLAHDPRCLDSMNYSDKFSFIPHKILSQKDELISYKGKLKACKYSFLETAICYNQLVTFETKRQKAICIVGNNTNYSGYDRRKKIIEFVDKYNVSTSIYGDCITKPWKKDMPKNVNIFGVLNYEDLQQELSTFMFTYVIPIRYGWATTKYLESLLSYVLPIAHPDYGADTPFRGMLPDERWLITNWDNDCAIKNVMKNLQDIFVKPYLDGKALSNIIYGSFLNELGEENVSK